MRLLKLALISVVVLFGVIYLLSLLIPSRAVVSRAIDITLPKDAVVSRLTDLRDWKTWNALVSNQELTNQRFTDHSFTADQLQVIMEPVITDTIKTRWIQQGGKEIASGFTCHSAGGTTVVQWYFDIRIRWYPWEKLGSIIFDKQLGPPMEQSLANLKKVLEKTP